MTGLDNSELSLHEARRRYHQRDPAAWGFDFDTALFDIADAAGLDRALGHDRLYDVVSSQFAMHYCFGSLETAQSFFGNVVSRLKPGGIFICTFTDGESVLQHLRRAEPKPDKLGEHDPLMSCDAINFDAVDQITQLQEWIQKRSPADPSLFGHKYNFCLYPHVQDIAEYITASPVVEAMAAAVGLRPRRSRSFLDWLDVYKGKPLSSEEKQASMLYSSYEFVKCADAPPSRSPVPKHAYSKHSRSPRRYDRRDDRRDDYDRRDRGYYRRDSYDDRRRDDRLGSPPTGRRKDQSRSPLRQGRSDSPQRRRDRSPYKERGSRGSPKSSRSHRRTSRDGDRFESSGRYRR